jgi:hypothetical protein
MRRPILLASHRFTMTASDNALPQSAEDINEALKREWTDQFVEVDAERPELTRFKGTVGRVVTINWNNRALVDFQDGGWYDVSLDFLRKLDASAKAKFDFKTNSAQPIPEKQG